MDTTHSEGRKGAKLKFFESGAFVVQSCSRIDVAQPEATVQVVRRRLGWVLTKKKLAIAQGGTLRPQDFETSLLFRNIIDAVKSIPRGQIIENAV